MDAYGWSLIVGVGIILFSTLFSKRQRHSAAPMANLHGPGTFEIEVVGESRYQDEIESVAGGRTEDGCEQIVDAMLVLEDTNPHDPLAVRIDIEGSTCGYLSRSNARAYRRQLEKLGHGPLLTRCRAMIVGGWDRGDDDRGHFGVRLDLPTAS